MDSTKISKAVELLRVDPTNAYYGKIVEAMAELLNRVGEIAPYWSEPYAAPLVPIIEQATRVAHLIVDTHSGESPLEAVADG